MAVSFAKKLLTVGAGTAMAQVITAASTPILTRVFPPEAHAAWAVFFSITAIFSGIAALRYELALVLPTERTKAAALVLGGLAAVVGTSLIAGLSVAFLGSFFVGPSMLPVVTAWSWLVPLSVLAVASFQLGLSWCTREASFRAYALAQFGLPVGILAAQFLFALAGYRSAQGLIGGTVCGQLAACLVLAIVLLRKYHAVFREALVWPGIWHVARTYYQYPLFMTPYTLVGLLRERLAYFLLGRFGVAQAAGYYGLVARLINLPNSFVVSAVRPVFFQHAVGSDLRTLEEPLREVMRALGICMLLVWAPCAVHASWLMEFVFGPAWGPAAPYAIALSIPAVPLVMGNWADRMLDVLGRQRLALVMELVFSVAAMGGLLGGFWWFGDLLSAVMVQSILLTIYYLVWLLVLFRVAGYQAGRLAIMLVEVALVGGAAWCGAYLLAGMMNPFPAFLVSGGLGGVIVLAIGIRTWRRLKGTWNHGPDKEGSMRA